jgi:hypothetical protein
VLAVLVFAVVAYPAVAAVAGRAPMAAQVFALTPDPTAVATLGVLVLGSAWRWWMRLLAAVVPLTWLALSVLTSFTLGWSDFVVAPALAAALLIAMMVRAGGGNRQGPPQAREPGRE